MKILSARDNDTFNEFFERFGFVSGDQTVLLNEVVEARGRMEQIVADNKSELSELGSPFNVDLLDNLSYLSEISSLIVEDMEMLDRLNDRLPKRFQR